MHVSHVPLQRPDTAGLCNVWIQVQCVAESLQSNTDEYKSLSPAEQEPARWIQKEIRSFVFYSEETPFKDI